MDIRRYILAQCCSLRGWKLLPYAVQHLYQPKTLFFRENEWRLIKACDGKTDIDFESLSQEERGLYKKWLDSGLICPANGEALRPEQQYRSYNARFKESVLWAITGKCNYKCRHCFMSAPHGVQGEPEWGQLMTMLDAFERCGIKAVELTGGEPLVRRDLLRLADEILRRGMVISAIYTNGMLVTDSFLDELEKRHIRPRFQFSFDGADLHDMLRGVDGAEQYVRSAMERCRRRGLVYGASMVMFRENIGCLRETVRLLAELGCDYLKAGRALPMGEWKAHPEHWLTQAEVYDAFLRYIPFYFEDGRPLTIVLEGFFSCDKHSGETGSFNEKNAAERDFGKTLMCGHVRREMYVSPQGKVMPCMLMTDSSAERLFPNMLEVPLEKILGRNSCYMDITDLRVSDYMAHSAECRECRYRAECCGGCRAMALLDHPDDYLAKDESACMYFRDGWKAKKDELLKSLGAAEKCYNKDIKKTVSP